MVDCSREEMVGKEMVGKETVEMPSEGATGGSMAEAPGKRQKGGEGLETDRKGSADHALDQQP
jgi:hypothetical protein